MKKAAIVLGLATIFSVTAFASSFADSGIGPDRKHGHGVPAPELGASALGLIMAGGIALYVVRRRRESNA
jgi:LPXTG-motif cell wall-anchored protein